MSAHIEWNIDLTIFRDDSKKITESKAQELYSEIMELIEFEYGLLVGGGIRPVFNFDDFDEENKGADSPVLTFKHDPDWYPGKDVSIPERYEYTIPSDPDTGGYK